MNQHRLRGNPLKKILHHMRRGSLKKVISKWIIRYRKKIVVAINKISKSFKKRRRKLRVLLINRKNKICHGPSAPRFGETIWVKPHQIKKGIPKPYLKERYGKSARLLSGKVISKRWPSGGVFWINEFNKDDPYRYDGIAIKLICCIAHWGNGYSWEKTGIIKYMEEKNIDGGINIGRIVDSDAIKKRYSNLDKIFEQVKREGRIRLNSEVDKKHRYKWGPGQATVHIGPDGELYWGGGACHRFAIAYVLRVPLPARIGLVHKSAIPFLNDYRDCRM